MISDCCGAMVHWQDICSRCGEHCEVGSYDHSDDAYDAAKDEWVLGDEPMSDRQRREQDSWDETCRQNEW
jgi:hypothetical protein